MHVLLEDGPFRPTLVVSKFLEYIKQNTPSCNRRHFFSVFAVISPTNISFSCIIYIKYTKYRNHRNYTRCTLRDLVYL